MPSATTWALWYVLKMILGALLALRKCRTSWKSVVTLQLKSEASKTTSSEKATVLSEHTHKKEADFHWFSDCQVASNWRTNASDGSNTNMVLAWLDSAAHSDTSDFLLLHEDFHLLLHDDVDLHCCFRCFRCFHDVVVVFVLMVITVWRIVVYLMTIIIWTS